MKFEDINTFFETHKEPEANQSDIMEHKLHYGIRERDEDKMLALKPHDRLKY